MPTIQNDNGTLWSELPSGTAQDFVLDFARKGEAPVTLTNAEWTSSPPLTFTGKAQARSNAMVRIGGGTPGRWHMVRCTATLASGATDVRQFRLLVQADDMTRLPAGHSAWGIPLDAVMTFRRQTLIRAARQYMPDADLSDALLWSKMRAAESELERALSVWLTPREVRPFATPPAELAELAAAGHQVATDPGYDYAPGFFSGDSFGRIDLRHPHVSRVHDIRFTWPSPTGDVFRVPIGWVRLEPKPGVIQLLPTGDAQTLPLNAFMLSALGGGRTVPLLLQVSYRAGIENAARDYPDVLDLLGKMATLSILDGSMMPPSGSVSADGLSQSFAWDADKHREAIKAKTAMLRQALRGIELA